MGIAWILIALVTILHVSNQKRGAPFSLAYWGLVFPNGVFALFSLQLAKVLDSPFFRIFGMVWIGKLTFLSLAYLLDTHLEV